MSFDNFQTSQVLPKCSIPKEESRPSCTSSPAKRYSVLAAKKQRGPCRAVQCISLCSAPASSSRPYEQSGRALVNPDLCLCNTPEEKEELRKVHRPPVIPAHFATYPLPNDAPSSQAGFLGHHRKPPRVTFGCQHGLCPGVSRLPLHRDLAVPTRTAPDAQVPAPACRSQPGCSHPR